MSSSRTNNGPKPPTDEKKDREGGHKAAVLSDGPTQVRRVPGFGQQPDLEGALGLALEDTAEVPISASGTPEGAPASAAGGLEVPDTSKSAAAAPPVQEPSVIVADQPAVVDENSFEGKLKKMGWTYVRPLGEGGMGRVFLASNDDLDELFVVKMMHTHLSNDEATKERFKNEAKAARSVNHQNVIKVLIPFKIDGDMFLPMEYVEGETLESRVSSGLMDWSKARDILRQICEGMQAIHDQGIVHRDIKPDNIILEKNNGHGEIVKIIDFGLARKETVKRQYATIDGSVMGSPEYMSPEQAKGGKVDARSDIYSVGAVFYQLLTGTPPFERDPEKNQNEAWMEIGLKIINEPIVPPIERTPERPITQDVNDIVMSCLEKEPAKRPKSMNEVKDRIMAATGYELPRAPVIKLTRELAEAAGNEAGDPGVHSRPTDQSLPKPAVEMNPGVLVSQSLLVDAAAAQAAIADAEKTAIVRDPQRGKETIITSAVALQKSRKRLNRALLGGAAALGAAAAISAAIYFGSDRTSPARPVQPVTNMSQPLVDAGPAVASRPVQEDAAPIAPLVVNRTVTFRTNVDGVEVLRGDESVCTTEGRTCSVQVQQGSEEIAYTFRKSGFRDAEMSVTPDADRTLTVRLVPERTRPAGSNRPPRPPPGQADPLQNMVPNYNKKQ